MPTPIPAGRLPALKAALAGYGDGDRVSQRDLADLYGVAPSRLSTLVKSRFKAFPDPEKHDDKTHWYPARAAVQSMIAYMEGSAAERQAQAVRHTAVMAGVQPARAEAEQQAVAAEPPMTATELDRLASVQTRLWRLAKEQGLYVLAEDVRLRAREANALFVRSVTSIPSRIDPNGALPPDVRTAIERQCRQIVLDLHDKMTEMMGADDEAVELARGGSGTHQDQQRRRRRRSD